MSDEITESAKAVQEVAKTASDLIKASEKAGSFVAKYIHGPATQVALIVEERLKFYRAEQWLRMSQKLKGQMNAAGVGFTFKPLPLAFAVDAIEQGVIEESDELQELWARLITNAADAASDVEPRHAYISILKDLTQLDAAVFQRLYSVKANGNEPLQTCNLPDAVCLYDRQANEKTAPPDHIKESLSNIERLGLVNVAKAINGMELHYAAYQTYLGHQLTRALRKPGAQTQ